MDRFRQAAALASGPAEVIDFLLPLWAASALGASPGAIGLVVAVEALISLVVRPGAGVLADRYETSLVAAAGAALSAVALGLYAAASGIGLVAVGAALGGAGGALFWVALRADVGRHLDHDPAAYARLLSSEQLGALIGFTIAMSLLGALGYRPLFLVGAAAYGLACLLLVGARVPRTHQRVGETAGLVGIRAVGAVLAPLIAVTALTAGVEAALSLLLILHLQSEFDLDPRAIAVLFLPGAILLVVLPERAFKVAVRLGRTRSLIVSLMASAAFAIALAAVGSPLTVALMWTLWAACLAAAVPVEQSTVAAASRDSLGRGLGLYEAGTLLGILLAAPALGALYGGLGWSAACITVAGLLLTGAALIPRALRAVGLPDELAPP